MKNDILKDKQIIFFGTGNAAKKIIMKLENEKVDFNIKYFVDNNKEMQGKEKNSMKIFSPSKLLSEDKQNILIIVASMFYKEIKLQLINELNFEENKHFINGLEYFNVEIKAKCQSGYIDIGRKEDIYSVIKGRDPIGRLIINKQNREKIYRGVFKDYAKEYREIYKICNSNGLIGNEIVDTKITENIVIEPFDIVFEHEYIKNFSYAFQWSPFMYKDAAIAVIDLICKLNNIGLGIQDSHVYNIGLNKNKFQLIDFGAISKAKTFPESIKDYISYYIFPLVLMSKDKYFKARIYVKNFLEGFKLEFDDICKYMDNNQIKKYDQIINMVDDINYYKNINSVIEEIRSFVLDINLEFKNSNWSSYQFEDNSKQQFDYNKDSLDKRSIIMNFIESKNPKNIIDIGGNLGWFCFASNKLLISSILVDYDYACIDKAYKSIKDNEIKGILPIVGDFQGLEKSGFKSECVLALALIHHLVFHQLLNFQDIVSLLEDLTSKYLIIEFVHPYDKYLKVYFNNQFEWYNMDNFIEELKSKFNILDIKPSDRNERSIIFAIKK